MKEYSVLGVFLDLEGFAVSLIEVADIYRIEKSYTHLAMPDNISLLDVLTNMSKDCKQDQVNIIGNFTDTQKRVVLQQWNSEKKLRIRSTSINLQDALLTLNGLLVVGDSGAKVGVGEKASIVANALYEIDNIDNTIAKQVIEGSTSLNIILMSLLYSLAWLEMQRRKFTTVD